MAESDAIIALDNVTKAFRRHNDRGEFVAVDRLSFAIKRGEIVAVLGKTGCGKSTVFNLIAGLVEPSSGAVQVLGHDAFRDFGYFRGKIGIVFQGDRLMPWRTALENVLLGLQILDAEPKQARKIASGWLARLGLAGHENDYPHALSGGMRQRVSIARAFAVDPEILLCDEPFSALDEMTARDLRTEFGRLVRQNGKTAVFVTHSISEALQVGDRVLVFHRPARIALEATVAQSADAAERDALQQRILQVMTAGAGDEVPIAAESPAL
jgi:NitT/TauT family transport system ATP-binding protein